MNKKIIIENINIKEIVPLISPQELKIKLSLNDKQKEEIIISRKIIKNILAGLDPRKLAMIGPCSIHDPKAAIEYAKLLNNLHLRLQDKLYIVMRVYFEKPRTVIGWKGLINDPDLNDSRDISKGLHIARQLLLDITHLGLPIATEMLDPISPQYTSDLISWASIGARTTESQTHRELASGVSMPVGFKNGTEGGIDIAIGAMQASKNPHSFLGIDENGQTSIVRTKGNPDGHLILRGGRKGPNYDTETIKTSIETLKKNNLNTSIIVDCSHSNSNKDFSRQPEVLTDIGLQRKNGNQHIVGFMLESCLNEGNQKISSNLSELAYGVSVTDACIGWQTTERIIKSYADSFTG